MPVGTFVCFDVRIDSFKPNLAPVRIHSLGTVHTARAVSGLARDILENDAGSFHLLHFSRLFVNDFGDAIGHSVRPATVGHKLSIPVHTTVKIVDRDRLQNLLM
jgi:hypothetical protein